MQAKRAQGSPTVEPPFMRTRDIDGYRDLPLPRAPLAPDLFTTRTYPLYYQQIPKCGCTWLRSLFAHLDGLPARPDKEALLRPQGVDNAALREAQGTFIVIRDPYRRFLSLYFDKVLGTPGQPLHAIGKVVRRRGLIDEAAGASVRGHRRNCRRVLEFIEHTMQPGTRARLNPHWQVQRRFVDAVAPMDFEVFTLDGLAWQLPATFGHLVPGLAEHMAAVPRANVSPKPVDGEALLDRGLRRSIEKLYSDDLALYALVQANWQGHESRPGGGASRP